MNSNQARKKAKRLTKESGLKQRRNFLWLTCAKCNKSYHIRVNDKKVYTEKVIKNWTCLLCK